MADDAANAATGGTPGTGGIPAQAAAQQAQQQNGTGGTPGDGGTPNQAEDTTALREAIRKERERAEAAEKRLKALEEKDLPEAERSKRRLDELTRSHAELETQLRRERLSNAVIGLASKLGFADTSDAVRLLDTDDIEFDASGRPQGIEAKLRKLLADKPYLASAAARATGSADQGSRGGTAAKAADQDFNAMIRRAAGRG